ncbi:MAG: hypothetical protein K8953_10570, partial [Proteobacteria bacterium]|nr:hypothetical protein [Pseudomonadota bacterium]
PVLNADGTIKTEDFLDGDGNPVLITTRIDSVLTVSNKQDPVTTLAYRPLTIIPANKVRRDNAPVNYIVGGTTQLDLAGQTVPLNEDGTKKVDSTGVEIDHNPVTNGIANRGGLSLSDLDGNTDAASGFAFASATFATRSVLVHIGAGKTVTRRFGGLKLYTGLLADTSVGAPLSDVQTNTEWAGKINAVRHALDVRGFFPSTAVSGEPVDFTLLVTFDGDFGTITNKAPINLDTITTFNIDGRFTHRGVIFGKTSLFSTIHNNHIYSGGRAASGSLTGLIGADGVVAAFISDERTKTSTPRQYGNYVGGFVAVPPTPDDDVNVVNYSDWARNQKGLTNTPNTVSRSNQFLGTAASAPALTETGAGTVTIRGSVTLADDANSGVAFFTNGTATHSPNSQYYAGLLAGTNLGAPINN